MATKCLKFVRGRVVRFTRLDGCGRPIYGDDSVVTSKGFIQVSYTANIETGTDINVQNAAGETCVREAAVPQFVGYTLEIQFCDVDPELFSLATGQAVVFDYAGNAIGFDMDTAVSAIDTAFALELWSGAPSQGCAAEASEGQFGYFLTPYVQGGVLGDFTVSNDAVTFTISNAATKDGNAWGVGPYNVLYNNAGTPVPAPLPTALPSTVSLRTMLVDVAPPTPECGARPLLDPSDTALTSVAAVATLLSVVYTPTPSGSDPWWVDFGDGTWDYNGAGTAITHVYAAAGTYTWNAWRGASHKTGTITVAAS